MAHIDGLFEGHRRKQTTKTDELLEKGSLFALESWEIILPDSKFAAENGGLENSAFPFLENPSFQVQTCC